MPFLHRSWLGDQASPAPPNLRFFPATDYEKDQAQQEQAPQKANPIDPAQLPSIQNKLKENVTTIMQSKGSFPIQECSDYEKFKVDKTKLVFKGQHSSIYRCNTTDERLKDKPLLVREFKPTSLVKPDDFFLKVLSVIGTNNANIIGTYLVCADPQEHVFLYQDFAGLGNGLDYIKSGQIVAETQMLSWARAIYAAMDFLGDHGIAHRAIQPKHIFLSAGAAKNDIAVKLGSFRDSMVYWDADKAAHIFAPCKPMSVMKCTFFQAPEVFADEGKEEVFSPVEADIWSFGATMFYFVGRVHAFNVKTPEQSIDGEIRNAIALCNALSDPAKYWLFGLMRSNSKLRTEFDDIPKDPWYTGQADIESDMTESSPSPTK